MSKAFALIYGGNVENVGVSRSRRRASKPLPARRREGEVGQRFGLGLLESALFSLIGAMSPSSGLRLRDSPRTPLG